MNPSDGQNFHSELTVHHKAKTKMEKKKPNKTLRGFSVSAQGIICFPSNNELQNSGICHIVCSTVTV